MTRVRRRIKSERAKVYSRRFRGGLGDDFKRLRTKARRRPRFQGHADEAL